MNIAVFTSGGDAPGMNAAIRAVTRAAIQEGHRVFGVSDGFKGLIKNEFKELNLRSVANIIHRGGTVLKTSRCFEFKDVSGRAKAFKNLKSKNIECIIGLGGDGTIKGLEVFHSEYPSIQAIGVPCTIDNDYVYSENTIGFATAVETAVEAIDKIRDTASSHERTFVVEVMGRNASILAYSVAISAGAECVVDLSVKSSLEKCVAQIAKSIKKGKLSSLIVTLEKEGDESSAASFVKSKIVEKLDVDCRSMVLGHIQRGGSPLAQDRLLASRMGFCAVKSIGKGFGVVIQSNNEISFKKASELKEVLSSTNYDETILETLAN